MGQSRDPVIGYRGKLDSRVYTGLQGVTTQTFQEANSKNGTQFEIGVYDPALGTNTAKDFLFRVGATPVLLKDLLVQFDSVEISRAIYRAPTIDTIGSDISAEIFNLSDRDAKATTVQIFEGTTVTDDGTRISPILRTLGSAGTGFRTVAGLSGDSQRQRVLIPNTDYLLRVTNEDGTNPSRISAYATWHEGPVESEVLA